MHDTLLTNEIDTMETKYSGPVEPFCEELFFKKRIGESVTIPVSVLEPLLKRQSGDQRDVARRAFGAYITRYLVENGVERSKIKGPPDPLGQLCDFRYEKRVAVIVHKKDELQNILAYYGTKSK